MVANIDFFGLDGTSGGGDDIDLNDGAAGNIDPITAPGLNPGVAANFQAIVEGNDHTISNLNIDRVTSITRTGDYTDFAALFIACNNTTISNLTLINPMIRGRDSIGGICNTAETVILRNVHVQGGSVQGGSGPLVGYIGGLVGRTADNSHIENCSSSANVSGGWDQVNDMGGLVGEANTTLIVSSRSSGNVSDGGDGADNMGGLVGEANDTLIVSSRSSGNVSNGGGGADNMGGLVGYFLSNQIVSSRSSGNVSDGGDGTDNMGGLLGNNIFDSTFNSSSVRDSMSSGRVCDGVLTTSCAAGNGADNIGALIGNLFEDICHLLLPIVYITVWQWARPKAMLVIILAFWGTFSLILGIWHQL